MQYALIILIVAIGIVSFFYPKIKNIVLSSTNKGSKADYQKLKKDMKRLPSMMSSIRHSLRITSSYGITIRQS